MQNNSKHIGASDCGTEIANDYDETKKMTHLLRPQKSKIRRHFLSEFGPKIKQNNQPGLQSIARIVACAGRLIIVHIVFRSSTQNVVLVQGRRIREKTRAGGRRTGPDFGAKI